MARKTAKKGNMHHLLPPDGPGLKVYGKAGDPPWYGGGYCGICGHTGDALVPVRVRYWDCDDGWRSGVLCVYCAEDCASKGPHPEDFAVAQERARMARYGIGTGERLDILSDMSGNDHDAAHVDAEDMP